jgi:hypothetical protein
MRRPLLFLDVDGVLNPYGAIRDPARFTAHHLFPGEEPVLIDPAHGALIDQLRGMFDVVWATSWKEQANTLLAPLLGIPVMPVAQMPEPPFQPAAKVPVLAAYARGRAAAWIDDLHPVQARTWAASRPAPTLLLTADPATGLTKTIVDQALGWAHQLSQAPATRNPAASNSPAWTQADLPGFRDQA